MALQSQFDAFHMIIPIFSRKQSKKTIHSLIILVFTVLPLGNRTMEMYIIVIIYNIII